MHGKLVKLVRKLVVVGALTVASQAGADPGGEGNCFLQCADGTTAAFWGTAAQCCAELRNRCGGNGTAYLTFGWPPQIHDLACPLVP